MTEIEKAQRFLVLGLYEENAPRLAPALNSLRNLVLDPRVEWVSWSHCLEVMLAGSDIARSTADNQIRLAITAEYLERRGEYIQKKGKPAADTRMVRLLEWPDEVEE